MANFTVGQRVEIDGKLMVIHAVVRGDDDPRKCVPYGFEFSASDAICSRERLAPSYLVAGLGQLRLRWLRGAAAKRAVPHIPPRVLQSAVFAQALAISDGTMATLTGLRESSALQSMRARFVEHVQQRIQSGQCSESSWLEAWRWFINSQAIEEMPAYSHADRLFVVVEAVDGRTEGWISPDGRGLVSRRRPPRTLEGLAMEPKATRAVGELIRVGMVRRHWLTGAASEAFAAWAAVGGG